MVIDFVCWLRWISYCFRVYPLFVRTYIFVELPLSASQSSLPPPRHGCCSDNLTPAAGPDGLGCPPACAASQFGFCPDSDLPAHGPDRQGCCVAAEFGCCPDNVNPASGPDLDGMSRSFVF